MSLMALRRKMERIYLDKRGIGSGARFTADLVSAVGSDGTLLDIGCGEGELRKGLNPGATYVGLDRYFGEREGEYANWQMRPSVIGDAHRLPFRDGSVDVVALMHVLENVVDPQQVFAEISRLLKPGGVLFVDVPFMYQIHHAPNDHHRFTPYALNALADRAGLRVREIRPSGGYTRFIAYAMRQAPRMIRAEGAMASLVRFLFCWPLALLGYFIGKMQYIVDMHDSRQELVSGYHAVFWEPM